MQLLPKICWRRMEWTREGDRQWGPFLHARDRFNKQIAIKLSSVTDHADRPIKANELRISGFGHTFKVALPGIVRPKVYRVKATYWSEETIAQFGRDWYENVANRVYGFSLNGNFLQVFYGADGTNGFDAGKSKGYFLPWQEWEMVRHTLYGIDGDPFWEKVDKEITKGLHIYNNAFTAQEKCPHLKFVFKDYDDEEIVASAWVEEREWRLGKGYFKWLRWFAKPRISRDLDLKFSSEVGAEKGSWKGGTLGHSIEMVQGETQETAFMRYCDKHNLTYIGTLTTS